LGLEKLRPLCGASAVTLLGWDADILPRGGDDGIAGTEQGESGTDVAGGEERE